MHDTIIWRGMVVLLSTGAIACATGETAADDSAIAAIPPADTAPLAVPQAADSTGDTTAAAPVAAQPATATAGTSGMSKAPSTGGSIRAADTVKERRGYDRAIKPDFNDPSKRLPPAPDSTSPR